MLSWKSSYQELHYFHYHLSVVIYAREGLHVLPFAFLLYGRGDGDDVAGSVIVSSR
jgi:hypothetical protein